MTHIHTLYKYMHTDTHNHTHTHSHANIHKETDRQTHILYTHLHAYTKKQTHICTYTQTHTQLIPNIESHRVPFLYVLTFSFSFDSFLNYNLLENQKTGSQTEDINDEAFNATTIKKFEAPKWVQLVNLNQRV